MNAFGLKRSSADKFIKKRLKNPIEKDKSNLKKIYSIGVVADIDLFRNYDFSSTLTREFGLAPHQVAVCLLDPSGRSGKSSSLMDQYEVFDEKSFGMYGKIKAPALEEFVAKEFDLLINYTGLDWTFSKVVMLRSRARLIAGFERSEEGEILQDISIQVPENRIDTFHKELLKYLRIMNLV